MPVIIFTESAKLSNSCDCYKKPIIVPDLILSPMGC